MDYNKESRLEKALDAIEDTAEKGAVHLRQEVTSFFLQTSIKGVPRAIKSTNKKLKVVWAMGVLVLLGKTHYLVAKYTLRHKICGLMSFTFKPGNQLPPVIIML